MNSLKLTALIVALAATTGCDRTTAPGDAAHVATHSLRSPDHVAVAGTFAQTGITSLDYRPVGDTTIIEQTSVGSISGTMNGGYSDEIRVVVAPNGSFTAEFTITAECSVNGRSGVVVLQATDVGEVVSPDLATFAGQAAIVDASGELSGLRGVLEIEGTIEFPSGLATYDYSGDLRLPS